MNPEIDALNEKLNKVLETAFFSLKAAMQRAYLLFFIGAKQSKTITGRIQKHSSRTMQGIGINDCKYGLTKRKPMFEDSQKSLNLTR